VLEKSQSNEEVVAKNKIENANKIQSLLPTLRDE
jgi:hypothetical protein